MILRAYSGLLLCPKPIVIFTAVSASPKSTLELNFIFHTNTYIDIYIICAHKNNIYEMCDSTICHAVMLVLHPLT